MTCRPLLPSRFGHFAAIGRIYCLTDQLQGKLAPEVFHVIPHKTERTTPPSTLIVLPVM